MERSVVDLMTFLDVCQLYLHPRRKCRDLCTLWAILTYIRTEDRGEFLRWCRAYRVPHLRYREPRATADRGERMRADKVILKLIQELFNCGCLPPCDIKLPRHNAR